MGVRIGGVAVLLAALAGLVGLGAACATAGSNSNDVHDYGELAEADDGVGPDADADEDGGGDEDGATETGCPPGEVDCGAGCTDTTGDPDNCGSCSIVCSAPWVHTEPVCVDSFCVVHCAPGWVDLDDEPGCETACPGGGPETCNGVDDDCDGTTDDGFPCAAGEATTCTTPCLTYGSGPCTAECAPPDGDLCTPPAEACNGGDDDCDGATDEDLPCSPGESMPCTTPCGSGGSGPCTALCEIPTGAACRPPVEACNGVDDNCDGAVDEDFSCIAGALVGCPTSCGSAGTGRCTDRCTLPMGTACAPPIEACNGRDDDCNGLTDEGLPCTPGTVLPCVTSCGTAGTGVCSPLCELPSATTCNPPAEACNARDDDCDTTPDEGFPCVQGRTVGCSTSCGSTGSGTCSTTCGLPTGAACAAPPETCNAADDDCDTLRDEGFACIRGTTVACTTSCSTPGSGSCSSTCTLPTGAACAGPTETCNGADDDCDTSPDDGFPCVQSQAVACATSCGSTGSGTCSTTCALPTGAACAAPPETCNASDDDCDTVRDDGFACIRGTTVACSTSCGSSGSGTCSTTCTLPTGAACPAPAETCNAADDDCDGSTDEGLAGCATCPRNCAGRACGDDGCAGTCGTCVAPATCDAGGHCVAPVCPIQGCTTGTENRDRCSGARVIGRATARTAGGYTISSDTCSAYNRSDTSCWDAGGDHHYRIFLRTGDRIDVHIDVGWSCPGYSSSWWYSTFKIYTSAGCTDTTCATRAVCEESIDDSFNYAYTATADRWYILVVDGYTAFDDEGDYDLTVRLTCVLAGCEC